ncbi:MAG: phosphate acyltransferase PlsX [Polyangiaceae bacterium]
MTTIAVDAMGSDEGVSAIVEGVAQLRAENSQLSIVLVGDEKLLTAAMDKQGVRDNDTRVVHAPTTVSMNDKPGAALDAMPNCSILRAAQVVAEGQADALVSAGNTGAVILASSRHFTRLGGVRRVGLAAVHPTMERHGPHDDPFALMLDVGATLQCEAGDLIAFAAMGSAYSQVISGIDDPRVALLSNGTEAIKGTPAIVEAHRALAKRKDINFVGNVEGLDIPRGSVDVVVCEGFVGNIVLKMLEGVGDVARDLAKTAYDTKLRYKIALGMLASGIKKVAALTDWKQYGGAPIVGFDHTVIKAHGRSNGRAIRNAIKVAAKTVERGLTERIRDHLETAPKGDA